MPSAPSSGPARAARPRAWRRPLLWALVLLLPLFLAAGLWLGLPPLLKWAIERHGSEAIGRRIGVAAIEFDPLSLTLRLRDLTVAAARDDGQGPQFSIDDLAIDLSSASLWRLAPVFDSVTVVAPHLRLQHLGGGRSDIDDVLQRLARPAPAPDEAPARFRIDALRLSDGDLFLSDAPSGARHVLQGLQLNSGMVSRLEADGSVPVDLQGSATLDGAALRLQARGNVWARDGQLSAQLGLQQWPLSALKAHWPAAWPLQVGEGALTLDLKAEVPMAAPLRSTVGGQVALTDLRVLEARRGEAASSLRSALRSALHPAAPVLLALPRLTLAIEPSRVAEGEIKLSELRLERPALSLQRDARGQLNLERIARGFAAPTVAPAPAPAPAASASPAPLRVSLAQFVIEQAELQWQDAAVQPAARLQARQLNLTARALQWPDVQPVPFDGQVELAGATLRWQGEASLDAAQVSVELQRLALQTFAPYIAASFTPQVSGELGARARLQWRAPRSTGEGASASASASTPRGRRDEGSLRVDVAALDLRNLQLRDAGVGAAAGASGDATRLARLRALRIDDSWIDLTSRALRVGRVTLDGPALAVSRSAEGRWMAQDWLRTAPTAPTASPPASGSKTASASAAAPAVSLTRPAAPATATPDWRWQLGELRLQGGEVAWADRLPAEPVEVNLSALALQWRGPTRPGQLTPLQVSADVATARSRREPGQLRWRGELRLPSTAGPMQTRGQLDVERLPLHAFEPYLRSQLNLDLRRADASWRGTVDVSLPSSGVQLDLRGDAAIDDLRASTLNPREDLLDWKSLSLRGVSVSVRDGALRRLGVEQTALQDFFARVIIDPTGRINLQDLLRREADATPAAAAATTAPAGGSTSQPTSAPTSAPVSAPSASAASTAVAPAASADPEPEIRFGPIALVNGRVFLSDRFIQPNYSANLSELTGSLGAFANAAATGGQMQMAPLSLRGRAEGTATLDISGQLNPLAQPLALDLKGLVRDLELPPLSPYSAKYAGHGIERGKLSLDVEYRIAPDGQLQASNRIVLNQLSFGDRIEGSEAPNLPLRLAVALLSDRNGVIDINLPIGGSINDPQFRLGPIIWKVILNLIGKAITAPFALIAQAFSGKVEDLKDVGFAPGSASLGEAASKRLGEVAQMLRDRPALQLTVVGEGDAQAEQAAWRRLKLDAQLRAEKRRIQAREARTAGQTTGTASLPEPVVGADEYPALLREVYRRADIAKPRNLIGMAKDLPVPEMEALLLASIPVSADAIRDLALARSVAVRDFLASQQVPTERLFLGAPVLKSESLPGRGDGGQPRAELKLGVR